MDELLAYFSRESPDRSAITRERLKFLRTAKVQEREYWIWSYTQSDNSHAYVTVSKSPGRIDIGYAPDFYRLSPEQFMLGDYHGVF